MDTETKKEFQKVHKSIDDLATAVAAGFAHVDKRFEQVDKRFEQVDKRFEQVDKRFDLLESEVKELRQEVKSIRRELQEMPDNIDSTYSGAFNDLLERVAVIEQKLGIKA